VGRLSGGRWPVGGVAPFGHVAAPPLWAWPVGYSQLARVRPRPRWCEAPALAIGPASPSGAGGVAPLPVWCSQWPVSGQRVVWPPPKGVPSGGRWPVGGQWPLPGWPVSGQWAASGP